jgi:hypothetical protein
MRGPRKEETLEESKMSYSMDHLYSPYAHLYQQVFERGHEMKGYNFGNAPTEKNSPPPVQFARPLKWWSRDRPERLRVVRHIRDNYLHEILKIGDWNKTFNTADSSKDQSREKGIGCIFHTQGQPSGLKGKKVPSIHTTGEWAA